MDELDPAARNDEGLEAVGAQVVEQLDHGLIDEADVGPLEPRVSFGADPLARDAFEGFRRHAGVCRCDGIDDILLASRQCALNVTIQQRSERLLGLPFRMARGEQLDAIDRKLELEVERLLGPERAIVIEGDNAMCHGHELRRTRLGDARDERNDGLLRSGVIPGWQRILRGGWKSDETQRSKDYQCQ